MLEDRIIREKERREITGRGRTSWWSDEKAGRVPKRVQIGPNAVGWRASELQAWIRGEWKPEGQGVAHG